MFNEYEFSMLSKIKQKEMVTFVNDDQPFSSLQDSNKKTTLKAKVKNKPTHTSLCCEPACC